ncbi:hypothetical protein EYR36_002113 [Pleurotus pulmonarius]|nr:hypothetical protein EYR36_002113 [Pleurotus pulmonarius]
MRPQRPPASTRGSQRHRRPPRPPQRCRRPLHPPQPPTSSTRPQRRPRRPNVVDAPCAPHAVDANPRPPPSPNAIDAPRGPLCVPPTPLTLPQRHATPLNVPRGPPTLSTDPRHALCVPPTPSTPPHSPRRPPWPPNACRHCPNTLLRPPHPTSLSMHPDMPSVSPAPTYAPTSLHMPSMLPHHHEPHRTFKPRSTRSATKAQQEVVVEISVPKKQTKSKKKKITTSADRDEADKEANQTTVEHLTATARTLQESGVPLAPPARQVGTGVTLVPITPSITTSRIRHEEPDDVPQIASKDKGKGRDFTNLGSSDTEEEIDEGEDDEEKKSDDEEEKELDVDLGDEEDAVSSIAPSASISVAGTSTTPVNSPITAFPNDPLLLRIATRMEVPLHMTNSGKGNGGLVNMYARYQLAVGAMAKWNRLTTPWDGPPVEEALLRSIFIKRTNFGTYGALFKRCLKFPMLMDMLQNPDYNFASEAHTKVWGGREVGRMTLGKVLDELEAELAAEEARVVAEKAKKAREAKKKSAAKKATNFCLQGLWTVLSVLFLLGLLPCATAAPLEDSFPNIRFADFANVIKLTFGENISLATVLMLLFSITTNTDILNLHGQQRAISSNNQVVTSWMTAFVRAIKDKLQVDVSDVPGNSDDDDDDAGSGSSDDNMDASDDNSNSGSDEDMDSSGSSSSGSSDASVNTETIFDTLFLATDNHKSCSAKSQTTILGKKLDSLCQSLDLYTHNDKRQLRRKLLPISTSSIQPITIITPPVMGCSTAGCHGHGLTQYLRDRDISKVTLLRGSECFEKVPVLAGRCPKCSTMFWADHESFTDNNRQLALYLPNAKYLKVGKQVWVDRIVSKAVGNANYSFHASTAAITEFWNYSFVQSNGVSFTLTRGQVWKAFVLESIRLLAGFSNSTMIFMDNLKISELVTAAYLYLGDGGIIRSAVGHSCDECCHAFKDVADVIPNQDDNPAALAGHDENRDVPEYAGPPVEDAEAMDLDNVPARAPDGLPHLYMKLI